MPSSECVQEDKTERMIFVQAFVGELLWKETKRQYSYRFAPFCPPLSTTLLSGLTVSIIIKPF